MSPSTRFWSKVQVLGLDECWEWSRSLFPRGYGRVTFQGQVVGAHRVAYELTHGLIPQGLDVLHSCDNRKCCNPTHLRLGTDQDNVEDKMSRGRQTLGSVNGMSRLTENQVLSIRFDSRIQSIIAKDFGITQSMVSKIKLKTSWKHL
jgi:hypothetical protein